MTPLLYFTTSVSVLTLFAGAVVLLVWIPVTLLRLARRICKAVFDPSPPPKKQIEFEGWHPAHHKRAGQ
jgi:hypothetical protein